MHSSPNPRVCSLCSHVCIRDEERERGRGKKDKRKSDIQRENIQTDRHKDAHRQKQRKTQKQSKNM